MVEQSSTESESTINQNALRTLILRLVLTYIVAISSVSNVGAYTNNLTLEQDEDGRSGILQPDNQVERIVIESSKYEEIIGERSASFLILNADTGETYAGVNSLELMPVASAIKGPILLYFLDIVDSSIWDSLPTEYWGANQIEEVPEQYRAEWKSNSAILNDLWRMIVNSDNVSTGNVLAFAYNYYQTNNPSLDLNPITAFNNWSENIIGIDPQSGMRQWNSGGSVGYFDSRFEDRVVTISGVPSFYNNVMQPIDLAKYYLWLSKNENIDPELFLTAQNVLSAIPNNNPGILESTAIRLNGLPISKDGFVGPDAEYNIGGAHLTADAGLISDIPYGLETKKLIIVSMGIDAGDIISKLFYQLELEVREGRDEVFWPRNVDQIHWLRSSSGPLGENNYNAEKLRFIIRYVNEVYLLKQDNPFEGGKEIFNEALNLWNRAFPEDDIHIRDDLANRIFEAIYGNSGEFLNEINLSLVSHDQ